MSKQFIEGNTYVFTKKNFIKERGKTAYKHSKSWVNKCNGRSVKVSHSHSGWIDIGDYGFYVGPDWCKCIKEGGAIKYGFNV